jgi:hypothetical protein
MAAHRSQATNSLHTKDKGKSKGKGTLPRSEQEHLRMVWAVWHNRWVAWVWMVQPLCGRRRGTGMHITNCNIPARHSLSTACHHLYNLVSRHMVSLRQARINFQRQ